MPTSRRPGKDAPKFTEDELKTIASRSTSSGSTCTGRSCYVEPSWTSRPATTDIPINASHPKMQASMASSSTRRPCTGHRGTCKSLWGAKSIYITENGCAASDTVADDGRVYDSDRVMFLRACLTPAAARRRPKACRCDGYFYWSSQDNFEWIDGIRQPRSGMIYVDFDTLKRDTEAQR